MPDEAALLIADVYEAAGAAAAGEETAGAEGLTQARWQVLSVVSEELLTAPRPRGAWASVGRTSSASPTTSWRSGWPISR